MQHLMHKVLTDTDTRNAFTQGGTLKKPTLLSTGEEFAPWD